MGLHDSEVMDDWTVDRSEAWTLGVFVTGCESSDTAFVSRRSHKVSVTGLNRDNWSTAIQDEEEIRSLFQEFVDSRHKQ